MKTVFKREFFSAFHRLYGYIVLGTLMLASSILFFVYNLLYTNENVNTVCSGMSLVSALIVPIIAINAFPSRKRENTDVTYDMMPITSKDVILGKYFASLVIVVLPNVLIACYSVFSGFFASVDHSASYTALLGLTLFEAAWLSVCTFIAKISRSRVVSYVLCYVIGLVWYFIAPVSVIIPTTKLASVIGFGVIIALIAVFLWFVLKNIVVESVSVVALAGALAVGYFGFSERFAGLFETFIGKLSIFERFNSFVYGIFDLEGVIFFASVTFLFVFLTWRSFECAYEEKRSRPCLSLKKATSLGLAVLLVASVFAVSCAAAVIPNRFTAFDATLANKNSVSDEAKEFLSGLDKDVTLYILEPTGMEDYELYLEKIAAASKHLSLKKVFYADDPMFYINRDISTDSISANSIVVECGDSFNYLSYYNLFVYSNATLGVTDMTYSEYAYYRNMFASNESYYEYYYSLLYDTTVYFNADLMLCQYIEYTAADIIPANYYLTGHGEKNLSEVSNAFSGLGLIEINISNDPIPADAASILINMPRTDIDDAERDALLEYLAGGGQLTFVTDELNLEHANLCSVLAEYGMSAEKGSVKEQISSENESGEIVTESVTEFVPTVQTDNDVLYYLDGTTDFSPTVKNVNAITVDAAAKENLTVIPLLVSSSESVIGDGEPASYTLACAVETPNGAKLAWFTGGEAFNEASTDSATVVMYSLAWVTLTYESEVEDIPACLYASPTAEITSSGARLLAITLIGVSVAVIVSGIVIVYMRKKAK